MIGPIFRRGARTRDEAEKPFWISYSDLMTALMVLFLVVMGVALLAATRPVLEKERHAEQRELEIDHCMDELAKTARNEFPGVQIEKVTRTVSFGDRARFNFDSASLAMEQKVNLQQFVPKVLDLARLPCGKRWLKRVIVEGFTDDRGTYLYNLNLSLRRSESVLCALLEEGTSLSEEQRDQVRDLFLVGGYSSNSARESAEASRRIELRLEFRPLDEQAVVPRGEQRASDIGQCAARGAT